MSSGKMSHSMLWRHPSLGEFGLEEVCPSSVLLPVRLGYMGPSPVACMTIDIGMQDYAGFESVTR